MAYQDETDPYAAPNGPGADAPDTRTYDAVAAMYQSMLGRAGSASEINAWIQGTGGDINQIQFGIFNSPEGQAYGSRNANVKPAPGPENEPTPAPAPTGSTAPGPTATTSTNPGSVGAPAPTGTTPPPGSTVGGYTPPPGYVPPPAFQFDDFQGPTAEDVVNDPGYQFERDQGLSAIGANRAAAGTLNTGGTLKDYVGFANNLASTHFGTMYDRKLRTYQTNRGNAIDTYNTNYGTQYQDPYSINYASQYKDPFAMNLQAAQENNRTGEFYSGQGQQDRQFNQTLGQNNNQFRSTLDFNTWMENYKRSTLDPFDQRYKTLSLLK